MALTNLKVLLGTYPTTSSALTRPPKNASSAAVVAAVSSHSQTSPVPETSSPWQAAGAVPPASRGTCRAPPPPPSQHTPQQYASHFPSLPDSAPPATTSSSLSPDTFASPADPPPIVVSEHAQQGHLFHYPPHRQDPYYGSEWQHHVFINDTRNGHCGIPAARAVLYDPHEGSWGRTSHFPAYPAVSSRSSEILAGGCATKVTHTPIMMTTGSSTDLPSPSPPLPQQQPSYQHSDSVASDTESTRRPSQDCRGDDEEDDEEDGDGADDHHTRLDSAALDSESQQQVIRVRAVISGWKAGTIIGRQGAIINGLRQDSRCKIIMSDDPSCPDRTLSIIGPPRSVASVLRRVCFLLNTVAPSAPRKTEDITPPPPSPPPAANTSSGGGTVSFTLAVPSPLCGCLIGRKGAQIREFRQRFDVTFFVSSTPISDSLDRPVTITGPARNVAKCLREVCMLFAQTNAAAHFSHEGDVAAKGGGHHTTATSCLPSNNGTFHSRWRRNVTNAPGVHIHGQDDSNGDGPRGSSSDDTATASLPATRQRRSAMGRRPRSKPSVSSSHRNGSRVMVADDLGSHNEELLGNSIQECSFELVTGDIEVHLLVPNDIVGCIIGKGGKTISEIRETSGAFISITDGTFPPQHPPNAVNAFVPPAGVHRPSNSSARGTRRHRVILIRGPSKSVRTARYLMGSSILNAQRGGGGLIPLSSAAPPLLAPEVATAR